MSSSHNTTHNSSENRRGSIAVGRESKVGSKHRPSMSITKSKMAMSTRRLRAGSIIGDKALLQLNNAAQRSKKQIRIMDGDVDVTPEPLLQVDQYLAKQSRTFLGAGTGSESGTGIGQPGMVTPTDAHSQISTMQQSGMATTFGPISKPIWESGTESHRSSRDSVIDEYTEVGVAEPQTVGLGDVITKYGDEKPEELTEEDKEKEVEITLTETPTFWLLDLPGKCVEAGTDEVEAVKEQNERYAKLVKDRAGNDLYAEREMQTFNNGRKVKHAQTEKINMVDQQSSAATWDMYDTYLEIEKDQQEDTEAEPEIFGGETSRADSPAANEDGSVAGSVAGSKTGSSFVEMKTTNNVSVMRSVAESTAGTNDESALPGESVFAGSSGDAVTMTESSMMKESPEETMKKLEASESFQNSLFIMERIVVQNVYQPKLAIYRNLPVYPDVDVGYAAESVDDLSLTFQRFHSESFPPKSAGAASTTVENIGPHLEKLWSFSCELTKNFTVLCVNWNKRNPDILVVGYGQSTYRGQHQGLVCCWSIKNIEYPERVYYLESGATSVDFSASHPNLLGVGTYDGSVCVYDVGTKSPDPVLDNLDSPGKHTGPVWQIIWVEKERVTGEDKGQILVSISADGRVVQWSIRKGFEYLEVMKLKRVFQTKGSSKSSGSDSLINRFSSGMGLDFKANDSNLYIAGTEDGHIHRCSCSYNEQFLATYNGHTGPVYKVTWSPFAGDVFLSASADWSIKLWHQESSDPIMSVQPALKAVTDINWAPFSSTIFGCTTEDAVQIFDLETSTIDPIVTHPVENRKLTAFAFSQNSPCVVFGDSSGELSVMKVHNVFSEEQEKRATSWNKEEGEELRKDHRLQEFVGTILDRTHEHESSEGNQASNTTNS